MIRNAVYAGTWYPADEEEIKKYFDPRGKPLNAVAAVCPHAGWIYSGKTAGKVYSRLPKADTYVLVGPNHTGLGEEVSVYSKGLWRMPLGDVEVDEALANTVIRSSEFAREDYKAHIKEHSLEVQIPFIQVINKDARIVPITVMADNKEIIQDLGRSIAKAASKSGDKKVIILSSSDMSHYETKSIAMKNDNEAISRILELDYTGLLDVVYRMGITMCGAAPVAAVIYASRELGALEARQIDYSTSGDVSGDYSSVVGYAGIIIY